MACPSRQNCTAPQRPIRLLTAISCLPAFLPCTQTIPQPGELLPHLETVKLSLSRFCAVLESFPAVKTLFRSDHTEAAPASEWFERTAKIVNRHFHRTIQTAYTFKDSGTTEFSRVYLNPLTKNFLLQESMETKKPTASKPAAPQPLIPEKADCQSIFAFLRSVDFVTTGYRPMQSAQQRYPA